MLVLALVPARSPPVLRNRAWCESRSMTRTLGTEVITVTIRVVGVARAGDDFAVVSVVAVFAVVAAAVAVVCKALAVH